MIQEGPLRGPGLREKASWAREMARQLRACVVAPAVDWSSVASVRWLTTAYNSRGRGEIIKSFNFRLIFLLFCVGDREWQGRCPWRLEEGVDSPGTVAVSRK